MDQTYRQRGQNPKYPDKVKAWVFGDPVPEWLSDISFIKKIEDDGTLVLDTIRTSTGGIEIKSSDRSGVVCSTKHLDDFICYSENSIFVLEKKQFNYIYEQFIESNSSKNNSIWSKNIFKSFWRRIKGKKKN